MQSVTMGNRRGNRAANMAMMGHITGDGRTIYVVTVP